MVYLIVSTIGAWFCYYLTGDQTGRWALRAHVLLALLTSALAFGAGLVIMQSGPWSALNDAPTARPRALFILALIRFFHALGPIGTGLIFLAFGAVMFRKFISIRAQLTASDTAPN